MQLYLFKAHSFRTVIMVLSALCAQIGWAIPGHFPLHNGNPPGNNRSGQTGAGYWADVFVATENTVDRVVVKDCIRQCYKVTQILFEMVEKWYSPKIIIKNGTYMLCLRLSNFSESYTKKLLLLIYNYFLCNICSVAFLKIK